MSFGEWRNKKLLLQEEVAESLGFCTSTISNLESGKLKPTIIFRRKFIEVYGQEEYELIDMFK